MKNLQKRLNQLYEQQAIEEKKVLDSLSKTIDNLSPFGNIKNTIDNLIEKEDEKSFYSKNALTLLINKTIDGIIDKPVIVNQTLKIFLKKRLIDVLFDSTKDTIQEEDNKMKCKTADL